MMALAADIVLSNREIILNPAYSGMGLYGSEYWTHFFPERVLRNRSILFFGSRDRLVLVGPRFPTSKLKIALLTGNKETHMILSRKPQNWTKSGI